MGEAASRAAPGPARRRDVHAPLRGGVADSAYTVDPVLPRRGPAVTGRTGGARAGHLRRDRPGSAVRAPGADRGDRDHRPAGGEAVRLVVDRRRRPVPGGPGVRPGGGGDRVPGALDPHTPVAQGWLRASHRELDAELSQPWLPVHTHTNPEPWSRARSTNSTWRSCRPVLVVPAGYRIVLEVRGRDYEHDKPAGHLSNLRNPLKGCGPFLRRRPRDRPAEVFHNEVTLHTGGDHGSYLLLPVVPG